jgi:hypothetical protein
MRRMGHSTVRAAMRYQHGDDVRVGAGSGPRKTTGSVLVAEQRGEGQTLARRTFDMIDIVEILTKWYAGRSQNELAASLGVDRKTLRKYTGPARAAGIEPGGPPMTEADWRTLATGWFPELVDTRLRQVSWPGIEPHRDYIAAQVKVGVRVATIHQRLAAEHGLDASVASVRRWVRANLPEEARRAQVTVLRDTPAEAGRRRRSTTAGWGCGSTRPRAGGGRCGRS